MSVDEVVDVVDSQDHVIGTAHRGRLRDAGLNYRVVHVLLLDPAGRLLLQRIAPGRSKGFVYGSSVAGHVLSGESYDVAAARETREELGIAPRLFPFGKTWLDEVHCRKFIGVFAGRADGPFHLDHEEVEAVEPHGVADVRRMVRERSVALSETFSRVFRHIDALDAWGSID